MLKWRRKQAASVKPRRSENIVNMDNLNLIYERVFSITREVFTSEEVFGISRDLPLNYIVRKDIDGLFTDSLKRKKHVAVFGSSKQGKTSLRKKYLSEKDSIIRAC